MLIRASIGTLAAAGLVNLRTLLKPEVAYLLQYSEEGCSAHCAFCTQSSTSRSSRELLSRIVWPAVDLCDLLPKLPGVFDRACIQSVIKRGFIDELHEIVRALSSAGLMVSLSTTPIPRRELEKFAEEGVDYLGVGLDAASPEVATKVGKPYSYWTYLDFVREAVGVFGRGSVIVHVIVGLGEELRDLVKTMKTVYKLGGVVSLFAFTPISGTPMENQPRPQIRYYRLAQLANYILSLGYGVEEFIDVEKYCVYADKISNLGGDAVVRTLLVSGCPGCNRPYYTESPRGELYNYPSPEVLPPAREVLGGITCNIS